MNKQYDTPKRYDIINSKYDAKLLENTSSGKIHWHSHFLLSVFKRNTGIQVLNNTEYTFEPGTAILMGPFDFHYNIMKGDKTFDAYSVKFAHTCFTEKMYEICSLENFPIVCKLTDSDFVLAQTLCDALIKERKMPEQLCHDIFVQNIIEQLVILIMRNTKKDMSATQSNPNIRKALLYIHNNFKNNITIDDVAKICHYTPNYLSTSFKNNVGLTFQRYLLDVRLQFARNLIKYGKKSCTEACFESGFNSVEYFSSAFKKKYGHSPNYYRLNTF